MTDEQPESKNPGHEAMRVLASTTTLGGELTEALERYWSIADGILEGSKVRLKAPGPATMSIESNLFSLMFLYSYFQAGIPGSRRVLYAAINQCLRGMVTGCDNLLDDEYKQTLDTDLPLSGTRFRSVLDIMVSDRVLFELLSDARERGELSAAQLKSTSSQIDKLGLAARPAGQRRRGGGRGSGCHRAAYPGRRASRCPSQQNRAPVPVPLVGAGLTRRHRF
jgi:hypothetical protein